MRYRYIEDEYDNHLTRQERQMDRLPVCDFCGEPIDQDDAFHIDDMFYCDRCISRNRKTIEI